MNEFMRKYEWSCVASKLGCIPNDNGGCDVMAITANLLFDIRKGNIRIV